MRTVLGARAAARRWAAPTLLTALACLGGCGELALPGGERRLVLQPQGGAELARLHVALASPTTGESRDATGIRCCVDFGER